MDNIRMKEHLIQEIVSALDSLARFFNFRRQRDKQFVSTRVAALGTEIDRLEQELTNLQGLKFDLEQECASRGKELEKLCSEHADTCRRFNLVSAILAARPRNLQAVDRFNALYEQGFLNFANTEASLTNEAEAVLKMQDILARMKLISAFPNLFMKTVGAIGGGFSSGKSAFLNSLFQGQEIKLPVGLNPVTSLPCYVVASPESYIHGHAKNGGVVPISVDLFNNFNPAFLSSFSFNLRDIMPMISLGASLEYSCFQHICIIDTPGYNPADHDGSRAEDRDVAMEQLRRAKFILWMIGLDVNGTIPKADIDFLRSPSLEGKQLYVVLNKADLRPVSQHGEIMREVEERLQDWDIPFVGISVYSASEGKEYAHVGTSLHDFLKEQNKVDSTIKCLKDDVASVFDMYINAAKEDKEKQEKHYRELHSLKLDMLEMGMDTTGSKAHQRVATMQSSISTQKFDEQLRRAKALKQEFEVIIDDFEHELPGGSVLLESE